MVCCVIERRMPWLLAKITFLKNSLMFIVHDLFNSEFGGWTLRNLISVSITLVSRWSFDRSFSIVIIGFFSSMSFLTNIFLHVFNHGLIIILSSSLLRNLNPFNIFRTFSTCRFLLWNNSGRNRWLTKCCILTTYTFVTMCCGCLVLKSWVFFRDDWIWTIFILLIIDLVNGRKCKIWVLLVFWQGYHARFVFIGDRIIGLTSLEHGSLCLQSFLFVNQRGRRIGLILFLLLWSFWDAHLLPKLTFRW